MLAFFALQILSKLEKILLILCCFCNTFMMSTSHIIIIQSSQQHAAIMQETWHNIVLVKIIVFVFYCYLNSYVMYAVNATVFLYIKIISLC